MTTTADPTYPEQLFLPGQAAAPAGPVDMMMMYLMHHAFRRDLTRFAGAVPHTPADDVATWAALAARWARFAEVLHEHHSGEDAGIWPFLLERADDDERATLLAMEAEHDTIDLQLTSCRRLLGELATDSQGQDRERLKAQLAVRTAETRGLLDPHHRHEETEAMVILQRHMTPEDWERIEKEHFGGTKRNLPLLAYVCNWLAEDLAPAVMDETFAKAGQGFRVVMWIGRRRFRRLERRAFRYLPVS
jgi:hemerythrin-like domain-containing protein